MTSLQQRELAGRCNRIEYHRSHLIQPHFVLVVLDAALQIVRVSANAELALGAPPAELIGQDFLQLVDGNVRGALTGLRAASRGRLAFELVARRTQRRSDALLFRSGGLICCEIELDTVEDRGLPLLGLQLGAAVVDSERDPDTLATFVCGLLQRIAGFDRTYYCEFDAEGNGFVSGEHLAGALPSLLEHRFPASDIPASVRPIYVLNRFRCIADASGAPVALSAATGGDATDLDLTYSLSRQPAPTHVMYLTNMGVRGSTSFSVVRDGRLAALFGGHNVAPRVVRYRQLAACQQLVESYVHRHTALERARTDQRRDAKLALVKSTIEQLRQRGCSLGRLVEHASAELCSLTDADGVVGQLDGELCGSTGLDAADARRLLACAADHLGRGDMWVSHSLTTEEPDLASMARQVSGVLAVAFGRDAKNILVWTRREQDCDARWSGNPSRAVVADAQGGVGPRRSFETWVEAVVGTARAWQPAALELATLFRDGVNQTLATHYQEQAIMAAEQANAYKTQFIANVSHELRTPMHSILGFAEIVIDKLDTMPADRQRALLGSVMTSGRRLLGLIEELLDLSKLEARQMAFHFEPGTIVTAIDTALVEASAVLAARQVVVTVEPVIVDPHLVLDAPRIVQVLVNLLANAAQASAVGGPVAIRLRDGGDAARPCLVIEVADRGIGIPEHQLAHVFDKFVQSERSGQAPGTTGLGLSICREIVVCHGGRIWAANNPEGGARVIVELPRQREGS